jgi:hypothetical protein
LVFPKPVALAKLTELVIAKLLAFNKTTNEVMRTAMFPNIPSCSNTALRPPLLFTDIAANISDFWGL